MRNCRVQSKNLMELAAVTPGCAEKCLKKVLELYNAHGSDMYLEEKAKVYNLLIATEQSLPTVNSVKVARYEFELSKITASLIKSKGEGHTNDGQEMINKSFSSQ